MINRSGGGGFFYSAFTQYQYLDIFNSAVGAVNVYGAWAHLFPNPVLTIAGRWVRFGFLPNGTIENFWVQIGQGAAGAETVLMPSAGGSYDGFYLNWRNAGLTYAFPQIFTFPMKIDAGLELSIRSKCDVFGVGTGVQAFIEIFD